jgi:hypothetical protein
MTAADFVRLPPGILVLVAVMLWPAIWAATLMIFAFAGDVRHNNRRVSPATRTLS